MEIGNNCNCIKFKKTSSIKNGTEAQLSVLMGFNYIKVSRSIFYKVTLHLVKLDPDPNLDPDPQKN